MEIEINTNLNKEIQEISILNNNDDSRNNNINLENIAENYNNIIEHSSISKKAYEENKISLSAKANIKFGMFCDLLEKCQKQKSKVKTQ
jgi:CRISPR/Cas system-associated protein Cas5 (RAMP superfamily)